MIGHIIRVLRSDDVAYIQWDDGRITRVPLGRLSR